MQDTYKRHKRIINEVKMGQFPESITCEEHKESELINYLINEGYLKGIRDQWGLVIANISTTETTDLYLEKIKKELKERSWLWKTRTIPNSILLLCSLLVGIPASIWGWIQIFEWLSKNNLLK